MADIKYLVSNNPLGWVYAEYAPGQRITAEMVSFDCNREDVQVNIHRVVLFYDTTTARLLLKGFTPPSSAKANKPQVASLSYMG